MRSRHTKSWSSKRKYIIGVDEAGRGPLAGAVSVGVVLLPVNFNRRFFRGIRDSKQLTESGREMWFKKMKENKDIRYTASFTGAEQIDRVGIMRAVRNAMRRALYRFDISPRKCSVLLDGGLKAPSAYEHQRTIIRGEEKEAVIALASIVAKVKRDRKMMRLAKRYPQYGFEKHKGYGTKEHYRKLKMHGLCDIHRRSFLRNLLN